MVIIILVSTKALLLVSNCVLGLVSTALVAVSTFCGREVVELGHESIAFNMVRRRYKLRTNFSFSNMVEISNCLKYKNQVKFGVANVSVILVQSRYKTRTKKI